MSNEDQAPERDEPERPPIEFNEENASRLSRFLSLILRHRASQFGLNMDDEGFVEMDDLVDVIDEERPALDWVEYEHIEELASRPGRKRFEVKGNKVRATYGHSFSRPIYYKAVEPPEVLYFGLPKSKMVDLKRNGIRPQGRQYVHLSEGEKEAMEVARHQSDDAVVIKVMAKKASESGLQFHRPTEGLFLVAQVSPEYLDLGESVGFGRGARRKRSR